MESYAGYRRVSWKCSSVVRCGCERQDYSGRQGASEPDALINWLKSRGYELIRVGLEAGPLSQWLLRRCGSGAGG